MLGKSC